MKTRWFEHRPVGAMRPGDYAWLAYRTEEERELVIGAFLRNGLASADKVICITDAEPAELPGLGSSAGLASAVRSGRLTTVPRAEACLTQGRFDPEHMMATVNAHVARAQREGYRGVRLTSDITWALHEPGGPARVLGCERRAAAMIAPSTVAMAICQVDRRQCTHMETAALRGAYEVLAEADPAFEDSVLRITRTFVPRGLHLEGELDASRRSVFTEALLTVTAAGGEVHIDLAEVDFIDVDALNAMVTSARWLSERGTIVLDHPPAYLAELVDLVGRGTLPGLVVVD